MKKKQPKVDPVVKIKKTSKKEEYKKRPNQSAEPDWTHPLPRPTIFDPSSIV